MAKTRLTTNGIAALKATAGKRVEVFDSLCPGLAIRVGADTKSWVVRYHALDGRQPRMSLGSFPAVGVAEARELATDVKRQARAGRDPASERKRAVERLKAQSLRTFDDLADAYLAACERGEWKPKGKRKRARTLGDECGILRRNVRPTIGTLPLEDISRGTIKALLRRMVDRGVNAQTNRTQAVIRQCFAYGINEDETGKRLFVNPATGFAPLGNEAPRRSTYRDEDLRRLWEAVEAPAKVRSLAGKPLKLSRHMAILLQLCMVLLQRKSEIAGMTTAELDLAHATWLIPPDRSKNGREHLVPLAPMAVRLIEEAITLADAAPNKASPDRNWRYVFPSPRGDHAPIRGDSVSHAQRLVCQAIGLKGVTVHDLRRTGATSLASERLAFGPFAVSQVLGHSSDTGGGAAVTAQHYNVYGYIAEKRRALEAWANLLKSIVAPAASGGLGEIAQPPPRLSKPCESTIHRALGQDARNRPAGNPAATTA